MLLIKTNENFRQVLQGMYTPLVVLPASSPDEARDASKVRAKGLALDARIAGFGVTVVESKDGELFVLVSSNESQVVGYTVVGVWGYIIHMSPGSIMSRRLSPPRALQFFKLASQ